MPDKLRRRGDIFGPPPPHVSFCVGCGDPVYREKVVHVGQGVVRDEDGSMRPEREDAMCPNCARVVTDQRWQEDLRRRRVGLRAIEKLVAIGAPQFLIDAEAVRWGFETSDVAGFGG